MHGRQVDLLAPQAANVCRVTDDAPVGVEQVHLDTVVNQHQLAEQVTNRLGLETVGVHQLSVAGNVFSEITGQALDHFQFVHAVGAHLHPRRRAAADQQQQRENQ